MKNILFETAKNIKIVEKFYNQQTNTEWLVINEETVFNNRILCYALVKSADEEKFQYVYRDEILGEGAVLEDES